MTPPRVRSFASDNHSGAHPRILQALIAANVDHAPAYGADAWTESAARAFEETFGAGSHVGFTLNGTGANILALSLLLDRPYQSVICSEFAHIYCDEAGAPERILGVGLRALPAPEGKLRLVDLERAVSRMGDPHAVQPQVVSITQSTEYGTLYSLAEVRAIADFCHARGMKLHMDGARIANAAVALGVGLREATRDCGVDVLSFGGMKNGLVFGEAVVVFDEALARALPFHRKQVNQLDSKMRFISAQYEVYLREGLWRANAEHSNRIARMMAGRIEGQPWIRLSQAVQANAIFACIPPAAIPRIQAEFPVALWDPALGEVRIMASFDTTEEEALRFCDRLIEFSREATEFSC